MKTAYIENLFLATLAQKGKGKLLKYLEKKNEKNSYHGEVCFSPMVKI